MKRIVFLFVSSILVFVVTICYRLGGFKSVAVEEKEYPALNLLFKDHSGPYHKISDTIMEVETWAVKNHLDCARTFGEYIDDPRTTDERHLRSHGGCVLSAPPTEMGGFNFKVIPLKKYVVAEFNGAPSIGPMKVYPKAEAYIADHKLKIDGPVIEIYSIKGEREAHTEYLFPIAN